MNKKLVHDIVDTIIDQAEIIKLQEQKIKSLEEKLTARMSGTSWAPSCSAWSARSANASINSFPNGLAASAG